MAVNAISRKIIRLALSLFCFQAATQLVLLFTFYRADAIVASTINIFIYAIIFYMATKCVQSKNGIACCGHKRLTVYRVYLGLALIISFFNLLGSVLLIYENLTRGLIFTAVYTVIFSLNGLELQYASQLEKELSVMVRPLRRAAAAAVRGPATAEAHAVEIPLATAEPVATTV